MLSVALTANIASAETTLADDVADSSVTEHTLNNNYTFSVPAGSLAGANRNFTIYGAAHNIAGGNKSGFSVVSGQTLTIRSVQLLLTGLLKDHQVL